MGELLTLGDFNLYFLDGRSFRTLHPEGSHIGIDQEAWLLKNLIDETNPSILIKGDQFFGGYHSFESFEEPASSRLFKVYSEFEKATNALHFHEWRSSLQRNHAVSSEYVWKTKL